MIENIKKYTPEDYDYQCGGISKKELEIMEIGYVGVFFKYSFKKLKEFYIKIKGKSCTKDINS